MVNELHAFNTVQDITGYLRISKSKFYEIVAAGLAPSFYIGISPRWRSEDITNWIIVQTEKSKSKGKAYSSTPNQFNNPGTSAINSAISIVTSKLADNKASVIDEIA